MGNPFTDDEAIWDAALELYDQDLIAEAFETIGSYGVGDGGSCIRWYRVIEAEATTRAKSRIDKVNDWLSIEYVSQEVRELRDDIVGRAVAACDEIASQLGWFHSSPTLLSILAEETEGPWATNPFGYCVHKDPYDKICLPNYLVDDPVEFSQAVAHEYAHVISDSLSDGNAPRWLEEAVSVLAERQFEKNAWERLREDDEAWLSASDLDWMIQGPGSDGDEDEIWLAYQQCGWLGRYLVSLKGNDGLSQLLREHANESVGRNLWLTLRGRNRCDAALRAIYSLSLYDLFKFGRLWLQGISFEGF